jgi:signal peptidase I
VVIGLIIAVVLGVFFGLEFGLGTSVPIRVVESGSMCVPYDSLCDGWSHPFEHTLHVGDIIVIQKINPADLNANYPNSDIIVYENPNDPSATPIVHRIVEEHLVNGTLYFQTKGDGNGADKWPNTPSPREYDDGTLWNNNHQGVPQNLVIGRVVMRIPYFGWVTLFLRGNSWGLPVIIGLIMLLAFLEFIVPIIRKQSTPKPETKNENAEIRNSALTSRTKPRALAYKLSAKTAMIYIFKKG